MFHCKSKRVSAGCLVDRVVFGGGACLCDGSVVGLRGSGGEGRGGEGRVEVEISRC